ncbi:hypothetical protein SISNIDRAFT_463856 [Sistotremastrum niveocremeum HHB9708]|uniref:Uncharacterized protein n=1 Tax=Sistotremastrum niveocremeum HHB9708 TaxID=1314777 RepID=A0A164XWL1_9AGAM|nr:hypothetical protein SISNIDRAFT_463856 [Sistotremastrum niveocremeum HHB9708]
MTDKRSSHRKIRHICTETGYGGNGSHAGRGGRGGDVDSHNGARNISDVHNRIEPSPGTSHTYITNNAQNVTVTVVQDSSRRRRPRRRLFWRGNGRRDIHDQIRRFLREDRMRRRQYASAEGDIDVERSANGAKENRKPNYDSTFHVSCYATLAFLSQAWETVLVPFRRSQGRNDVQVAMSCAVIGGRRREKADAQRSRRWTGDETTTRQTAGQQRSAALGSEGDRIR